MKGEGTTVDRKKKLEGGDFNDCVQLPFVESNSATLGGLESDQHPEIKND
jgi:hypothetical protein